MGVQKAKNGPRTQKRNLGPKSIWSCDVSIDREFYMQQEKKIILGVQKGEKRNLRSKINTVMRYIHRSRINIDEENIYFYWRKGENEPSEPKVCHRVCYPENLTN
jgi:hypothetical protein